MSTEIKDLIDALESMYEQYCDNGHSFMSAGEGAMSVLRRYGYKFDGGGRLVGYPIVDEFYSKSPVPSKEELSQENREINQEIERSSHLT
jgi:hypothetical protein